MTKPENSNLFPTLSRRAPPWASAVVLVLLLVVLGVTAVPRFGRGGRPCANESAAIATLKNIASAQDQMQRCVAIDCNGNGRGESATFAEMAGAMPLRTARASDAGALIDQPVLSSSFGKVDGGQVRRSGYVFEMFLPGKGDMWLREADRGGAAAGVVAERAEREWLCYAWPIVVGRSGLRAFVIDAQGNLLATQARTPGAEGSQGSLSGRAGHALRDGVWRIAANTVDAFGDRWEAVR